MKRTAIIVLLLALFFTQGYAQYTWSQKASMPTAGRYAATSLAVNGKAYTGLGTITGNTRVYDFWEYDPATNIWVQKANYPGGGSYAATGFSINGKAYLCLGLGANNVYYADLWEYDPATNLWTKKANFPGSARYGASAFVIDGIAYVGLGSYGNSNNYLTDLWAYNPVSNNWTPKAGFPGGKRSHAAAFTLGGYGYMGSGLSNSTTAKSDYWKYAPGTNSWTAIQNYPGLGRTSATAFILNESAYVGMGYDFQNYHNDFYTYNPNTNSWTAVEINNNITKRSTATAFTIGNKGYFSTGYAVSGFQSDLWAYESSGDVIGTITYGNTAGTVLKNVTVQLIQNGNVIASCLTNSAGQYSFYGIIPGDYILHCISTSTVGSITSTDAWWVNQHFLGFQTLSGIHLKAADVNNSNSVNVIDAMLCLKRFTGIITSFDSGEWAFDEPSFTIGYGSVETINIKGLCYGDVNGSFTPAGQ